MIIWMEYNEIEPLWGYLWNGAWNVAIMKKFYELERKLQSPIANVFSIGIKLYEIEFAVVPQ